jgi:hypothetical protein
MPARSCSFTSSISVESGARSSNISATSSSPCSLPRPDGHPEDILVVGVLVVPLRLQGLDLEGQHPVDVIVIGRKRNVAGQVVDDRKQPALLEKELHQLPVGRRQALLEELQGRVATEGLLQKPVPETEGCSGVPYKYGAGLLRRRGIHEVND